jgi:hypothetical protein
MRKYFEDTIEKIRERYPNEQSTQLAIDLGMPTHSLYSLANKMGIRKSPKFLASEASGRSNIINNNATRFKKGNVPVNKGKASPQHVKDALAKTQFLKGSKPHNTKPIGTIVTRKDKSDYVYKYIKIADSNWQLYQRYVFEKHFGQIPKSHIVIFRDSNQLNCDIENLQLISKADNAIKNKMGNYPAEIIELVQLKSKLIKKIKSFNK